MTETNPQEPITPEQKWAAVGFGLVILLFGVFALYSLLDETLALMLSTPQPLTVTAAAEIATEENQYVRLEEAVFLCDRVEYREGRSSTSFTDTRYTDIWLTDEDRTAAVFASFSGRRDCDQLMSGEPSGYLRTAERLPRTAGVPPLGESVTYLELCGYCGRSNSIALIIVFSIMIVLGGVMAYAGFSRPVAAAD